MREHLLEMLGALPPPVAVFLAAMLPILELRGAIPLGYALKMDSHLMIWLIAVAGIVAYAHLIPELRSIGTALLTGVSLASIVIGLAAQSTLGNLISGIALVLYRPLRVGSLPRVNTGRQAQDGAAVAHIGEAETAVAVGIDGGLIRISGLRHTHLLPARAAADGLPAAAASDGAGPLPVHSRLTPR